MIGIYLRYNRQKPETASPGNEPLLFGVSCVPEGVEPSSPGGDVAFVRQTNNPEGTQDTDGHNGDGE